MIKLLAVQDKKLFDNMLLKKLDGQLCLSYLKIFGQSKDSCISDLNDMLKSIDIEIANLKKNNYDSKNGKILEKLIWLREFEERNKLFLEKQEDNI